MTTRNRWDETRALIEAGWKWKFENCPDHPCVRCGTANSWTCCAADCPNCNPPAATDWDDTKQAKHDGSRQIYGGLGTPQREDQ